jgi:dienelactone hydrolase
VISYCHLMAALSPLAAWLQLKMGKSGDRKSALLSQEMAARGNSFWDITTLTDRREAPMRIRALAPFALTACVLSHAPAQAQAVRNDQPDRPVDGETIEASGLEFPETTGPFKVGRAGYQLVDSSRKEIFTAAPDDVRELVVTVHYPAEVAEGLRPAPYADARLAAAIGEAYHKPASLFSQMHSHAVEKAPCARAKRGYPVVIFSPGFKAHPLFYTAMLEELASQGFVVASVCHPYSTGTTVFPDGRVAPANDEGTRFELDKKNREVSSDTMIEHRDAIGEVWLADVRFVLDSLERMNTSDELLAGNLDVSQVGIFGHSFGGATAAAAVQRDKRFRAGINLDGSDLSSTRGEKIRNSFLWICSAPPDASKLAPRKVHQARDGEKAEEAEPSKRLPPEAGAGQTSPGTRVLLRRPGDPTLPPLDASNITPNDGLRAPPGCRITISGARHQTFTSDVVLLKSAPAFSRFAMGEDVGSMDGRRAVFVVNSLVCGFFRQQLRGETVPFLNDPSSQFPEAVRGDSQREPRTRTNAAAGP